MLHNAAWIGTHAHVIKRQTHAVQCRMDQSTCCVMAHGPESATALARRQHACTVQTLCMPPLAIHTTASYAQQRQLCTAKVCVALHDAAAGHAGSTHAPCKASRRPCSCCPPAAAAHLQLLPTCSSCPPAAAAGEPCDGFRAAAAAVQPVCLTQTRSLQLFGR